MKIGDKVLIEAEVTAVGELTTVRIPHPEKPAYGVNVRVSPSVIQPRKARK